MTLAINWYPGQVIEQKVTNVHRRRMYVTQNPELSLHIDALLRNERSYSARQLGNTEFAAVEDIKLRAAAARDIKRNRTAGDRINSNCWEGDRFSSLRSEEHTSELQSL